MICPYKFNLDTYNRSHQETWMCEEVLCIAWEPRTRYNPETKLYEGDCRAFMLDRKVSGAVNTHPN